MGVAMSKRGRRRFRHRFSDESGTTLIETMIACGILAVGVAGLMGLSSMAMSVTENQGHLSARTTEYAVDKMEQLLELTYGDAQSNTTFFPSINSTGTGLGGNLAVGTSAGSADAAAPVVGYADYLDSSGNVLCTALSPCTATPPPSWYYKRVWQISVPSDNLKQITVTAIVRTSVARAMISQSTVSAFKTNCPSGC
jgi:Flp pilus assembly protein TadG